MKLLSTYLLFILLWLSAGVSAQANIALEPKDPAQVAAQYGKLPMSFEANRGQTDTEVRFLSRGPGYALFITPTEAVFSLRKAGKGKSGGGQGTQALNPVSVVAGTSEQARTARPTPAGSTVGRAARSMPELPADSQDESLAVRMQLIGANPKAAIAGLDELPGKVNYLRGNDPKRWQTGVATYGKVKLNSVYDGVDLVYYGNGRQLEYDFIVAPGADPKAIRLNFSGTDNARLDATGDLLLHMKDGELRLQKPVVYQTVGGQRRNVDGRFVVHDVAGGEGQGDRKSRQIGFQMAAYDAGLPLVIDPVLVYSSYLGGNGSEDVVNSIAVDSLGNAYVTGTTNSSDFPIVNAKYPTLWGSQDAFVVKFSADGSKVLYSTYFGGSNRDYSHGIAVDATGNATVTGYTASSDFPTVNAKYPALLGNGSDAFVVKFSADGSHVLYSTYLGGSNSDWGLGIAVDSTGSAYVTGYTDSSDFPTANALYSQFQGGSSDAFVTKLSSNGQKLIYSTYLGGANDRCCATFWLGFGDKGTSIAVDSAENVYVTGYTYSSDFPTVNAKYPTPMRDLYDAFVTKLNHDGQQIIYSTYLGGNDWEGGTGIAVDNGGNAYVTGWTKSADFPTVNAKYSALGGANDAFVTKFNATGSQVLYSTYLGGNNNDEGSGIAVDSTDNAYVTGYTQSSDFPTVNAKYPALWGGTDAFIVKFSAEGSKVLYSTYLGGSWADQSRGITADSSGNAYVAGQTGSCDFPTAATDLKIISWDTDCNGGGDAFVAKFGASYLEIAPNNQDFGLATPSTITDRTFTVKNTANRTLTGTLVTTAPFSVVSGASFTLAGGASQTITVRFTPPKKGFFKATLKATGDFPATSVQLQGIAALAVKHVPVISAAVLQGAPGNAAVVSGRYFGPLPGELRIDGNPITATEWNDTFIRYTIPDLAPGKHTLTVSTAFGEASRPLQVLSEQPVITKLHPSSGAPGALVVIEGYNFGAEKNTSMVKIADVEATIDTWSDQKIAFKIPSLVTGNQYSMELSTLSGTATKTLTVRNLMVYNKFGDCDETVAGLCQPLIISVRKQLRNGESAELELSLENLFDRWYEVSILNAVNATVPGSQSFMIGPKQTLKIPGVTVNSGSNIVFFTDATSNRAMQTIALDLLYITATGGKHLPSNKMDAVLDYINVLGSGGKAAAFIYRLTDNIANKRYWEIVKQISSEAVDWAKDETVKSFLTNYMGLSEVSVGRLLGNTVYVGSISIKMLEQLVLPRYGSTMLVAE